MNDDLMFDYLLQMGAMRPEQEELRRKQAMVDALRQGAMSPSKGQMVSGHYVPGGLAGAVGQLGQAYFATQGQGQVDQGVRGFADKQKQALEEMRRRRMMGGAGAMPVDGEVDPYAALRVPGRA